MTSLEKSFSNEYYIPCINTKKDGSNKYDMLWYTNFRQTLGKYVTFWLLPTPSAMKEKGMYFPSKPEVKKLSKSLYSDVCKEAVEEYISKAIRVYEEDPKKYKVVI